jgi:hypothetical protein
LKKQEDYQKEQKELVNENCWKEKGFIFEYLLIFSRKVIEKTFKKENEKTDDEEDDDDFDLDDDSNS